jgi:hypothetical protein
MAPRRLFHGGEVLTVWLSLSLFSSLVFVFVIVSPVLCFIPYGEFGDYMQ